MPNPFLLVDDLKKHFGDIQALKGVSLEVREGEVFGLLGPNGAGKTTLLSIISCLSSPTRGQVLLNGKRVAQSDRELRRLIGIVPQELAIYPELTARENLRFVGELYSIRNPELRNRVDNILDLIGLTERADRTARTYSGGMKRRLNLGLALLHRPRLLLLDEPTAGVDPQSRNHLFEGVRRLNADGMTIIYTSHYLEEVQSLCSRIGIMDNGLLVACDTLQGLLASIPGRIRFRVSQQPAGLLDQIRALAEQHPTELTGIQVQESRMRSAVHGGEDNPEEGLDRSGVMLADDGTLHVETADVSAATVHLVSLLKNLNVELTSLEVEPPNLERVFLHLTGRRLRD